ncbi:hypothetical protein SAMN05421821_105131 [Mucilaginibacter lappiensis]|uniref:DUF3168 domain-containing protein n=1 Tax=Mucilaginibacter lappiensis TaxID=354630 RepID=A0ABR6PIW1_9SPHI|nr:hypothetical protein [Mucilaginibacter lappiensis]MBB6109713.1 hypothetical protein [Mucilaginibacter lappiensis]SIR12798.1 hypothetical protein SAMN05421821_105131 [Mucilaginibacter lappiensis]
MKNGFDMINDVRSLINVPAVLSLIDGKIYPGTRPIGRTNKVDIVVNALGVNNNQLQKGTANINIYAPGIRTTQEDNSVQYLPDYAKLNAIVKVVTPLVESQFRATFNTKVTDPGTPLQDADGNWLVSMQLSYQSIQTNYKNI